MRKALLVLTICLLAAPAWAGGGFSLFGSYAEVHDDATTGGAGARLTLGGARWVGDLTFTWYPSKGGVGSISGFTDNIQVIPTDFGIRYLFTTSGNFDPYVGAGFSFMYVNLNDGNADNTFGYYGMLGFNLGARYVKFFAEGLYRWGESDVSYRSGGREWRGKMDVGGWGLNAGVIWTF